MKYYHCIITVTLLITSGIACKGHNIQPVESSTESFRQVWHLRKAASNADRDRLHELIASGIDINAIEQGWGPALYLAAFDNDARAVRLLLECGANSNEGGPHGQTPLHGVLNSLPENASDAFEIVESLISYGADVNRKDVNGRTPLHDAVSMESTNENGETVSSKPIMELLLVHGANVSAKDVEGCTPLHGVGHLFLSNEDGEIFSDNAAIELLLAHGANIDESDAHGYTPLYYSYFYLNSLDAAALLIKCGADVNIKNNENGYTVLHEAAGNGDLEAVRLFVLHGADIHVQDSEGETPLHKAALHRNQEVVHYLTQQGASIHVQSDRNETPQDFLDEPDNTEPLLLPGNKHTYGLIVTDGLEIRNKLRFESVDYDTILIPSSTDIEGLTSAFKSWLLQGEYKEHKAYVDPDYILEHFDQYNREYAGFAKNSIMYIVCNMSLMLPDGTPRQPPSNRFSGGMDGGCSHVFVVFNAQTREVIRFRCNGM